MAPDAKSEDSADVVALTAYGRTLADGIEAALPGWVEGGVERLLIAYRGSVTADERAAAAAAGVAAQAEVGPQVHELLALDPDEQRLGPLALLRAAVSYPTAVLRAAGVPPVVRDEFAERQFPDDVYDLTPAAFADLDPALQEPGLVWGAAKAHVHLSRRRRDGQR